MATRLVIDGGIRLKGEVRVSAAKNAALPAMEIGRASCRERV